MVDVVGRMPSIISTICFDFYRDTQSRAEENEDGPIAGRRT